MIDAHCHLYQPYFTMEEITSILYEMERRGIKCISVSETMNDIPSVLELASIYPKTYIPFVGIHPVQGDKSVTLQDLNLELLDRLIGRAIGIGEIGLDFSPHIVSDQNQKDLQIQVFKLQLALAKKHNVYVNVHSRQAGHYCIDIMKEMGMDKVILHAFDGKLKYARKAVEYGWLFSIPGSVQQNVPLQNLVRGLPIDCIIIESDAPALGPVKGVKSSPLDVPSTLDFVAQLKGVEVEELVQNVSANMNKITRI